MIKICAWEGCDNEFEPQHGNQRYCCNRCSKLARCKSVLDRYKKKQANKPRKKRICVVCRKEFIVGKGDPDVCGKECRDIRDKKWAQNYYNNNKEQFRENKRKSLARLKADEPLVETEHRVLDGTVLDKAQMTVDEYNMTHGTNYSYGQYVFYVESKGAK